MGTNLFGSIEELPHRDARGQGRVHQGERQQQRPPTQHVSP